MAYTRFLNGFEVTTASSIDRRILLTKAEMLKTSNDQLYNVPDVYLSLCTDDKKLYLYDRNSSWDETTGYYHPIDNSITFDTPEAQANIESIIANSDAVEDINAALAGKQNVLSEGAGVDLTNNTVSLDLSEVILDCGGAE